MDNSGYAGVGDDGDGNVGAFRDCSAWHVEGFSQVLSEIGGNGCLTLDG